MGRAIMALVDRELLGAFGESTGDDESAVFAQRAEEELATREANVADRERVMDATQERLRGWSERLRIWEAELEAREQRTELASKLAAQPREATAKNLSTPREN